MPSPIAHSTAAYAVYVAFSPAGDQFLPWSGHRFTRLFLLCIFLCLLPDFGSIFGLISGDFARYHNSWEHSLPTGFALALLLGAAVFLLGVGEFWRWFLIVLLCYESHVLMDYFTVGRGVMLFWPFSAERWSAPIKIFYGLHWSDGWWTVRHLWTAVTEITFAAVCVCVLISWKRGARARP